MRGAIGAGALPGVGNAVLAIQGGGGRIAARPAALGGVVARFLRLHARREMERHGHIRVAVHVLGIEIKRGEICACIRFRGGILVEHPGDRANRYVHRAAGARLDGLGAHHDCKARPGALVIGGGGIHRLPGHICLDRVHIEVAVRHAHVDVIDRDCALGSLVNVSW